MILCSLYIYLLLLLLLLLLYISDEISSHKYTFVVVKLHHYSSGGLGKCILLPACPQLSHFKDLKMNRIHLEISKQPVHVWYKDVGGKRSCIDFVVELKGGKVKMEEYIYISVPTFFFSYFHRETITSS